MHAGDQIGRRFYDWYSRNPKRALDDVNGYIQENPVADLYVVHLMDMINEGIRKVESEDSYHMLAQSIILYAAHGVNAFKRSAALGFASGMHGEVSLDYLPLEAVDHMETEGEYTQHEEREVDRKIGSGKGAGARGKITIPKLRLREGSPYKDLSYTLTAVEDYSPVTVADPYARRAQEITEYYSKTATDLLSERPFIQTRFDERFRRLNDTVTNVTKFSLVGFFMKAYEVGSETRS